MLLRTQHSHIVQNLASYNTEVNKLKSRCEQIRDHLEQVCSQNQNIFNLLSKYVDELDEQVFYKDMLEVELDQHKETLAEKNTVIEAQEYLLFSAKEEVQDLANANAEKDQVISNLLVQIEQNGRESTDNERPRKRKIAS